MVDTGTTTIDVFHRNTDGSWSFANQTSPDTKYRHISNATRGPARRAIQSDVNGSNYSLVELEEQPSGAWIYFSALQTVFYQKQE